MFGILFLQDLLHFKQFTADTIVSWVSVHGHLNITCYLDPHGLSSSYVKFQAKMLDNELRVRHKKWLKTFRSGISTSLV